MLSSTRTSSAPAATAPAQHWPLWASSSCAASAATVGQGSVSSRQASCWHHSVPWPAGRAGGRAERNRWRSCARPLSRAAAHTAGSNCAACAAQHRSASPPPPAAGEAHRGAGALDLIERDVVDGTDEARTGELVAQGPREAALARGGRTAQADHHAWAVLHRFPSPPPTHSHAMPLEPLERRRLHDECMTCCVHPPL